MKPGTVGPGTPGCEVRLADDGEVICRGGNVFVGYLDDPEKTAEVLDDDGWFHSGDIGEFDDDGYFRIVDRKKELIITAGGKNVSPANLEAALKSIPIVGQAAAIGDNRPFVSALVVLDPEVAAGLGEPAGDRVRRPGATWPDSTRSASQVEAELEEVMGRFNKAERVKKVRILGEEWLPDSDAAHADLQAEAPRHPRPLRRSRSRSSTPERRRGRGRCARTGPAQPGVTKSGGRGGSPNCRARALMSTPLSFASETATRPMSAL